MSGPNQILTIESTNEREGRQNRPSSASRISQDRTARRAFMVVTLFPLFLIVFIVALLIVRTWPILSAYPAKDLIFGMIWKPDNGKFGFWPFIMGTVKTWLYRAKRDLANLLGKEAGRCLALNSKS